MSKGLRLCFGSALIGQKGYFEKTAEQDDHSNFTTCTYFCVAYKLRVEFSGKYIAGNMTTMKIFVDKVLEKFRIYPNKTFGQNLFFFISANYATGN